MKSTPLRLKLIILALFSSSAMAATITFVSPKSDQGNNFSVEKITSPFTVQAQFNTIKGLEHATEANGTFKLKKDEQGYIKSDGIVIRNDLNGVPQVAEGLVEIIANRKPGVIRRLAITAGDNLERNPRLRDYCITPYLNGNPIGIATDLGGHLLENPTVCTSHLGFGRVKFTEITDVDFSGDQDLKLVITYK